MRILSCILCALLASACVRRSFHTDTKVSDEANPGRLSERPFGGLVDLGVRYSPVSPEAAQRFWESPQRPVFLNSIPPGDRQGTNGIRMDSPSGQRIFVLLDHFARAAQKWVALRCTNLNQAAALAGQAVPGSVKFRLMASELNGGAWRPDPLPPPGNATYAEYPGSGPECEFGVYGAQPRPEEYLSGEYLLSRTESGCETADIRQSAMGSLILLDDVNATLRAGNRNFVSSSNVPGFANFQFLISGNFLIPLRAYKVSKGFAVPVMEFDPQTLAPLNFFDFGKLYLEHLKRKPNHVIISLMSEKGFQTWSSPHREQLGSLWHMLPSAVNAYVPQGRLPVTSAEWGYHLIPAGSTHFMVDAAWYDPAAGNFGVAIPVSTDELIRLYDSNEAWINPYDQFASKAEESDIYNDTRRRGEAIAQLMNGACVPHEAMANIGEGLFLAAELVIGGPNGRKMIMQDKPVGLLKKENGCFRQVSVVPERTATLPTEPPLRVIP